MTQKIYALLVGIDKYHPESGVSNLQGCVNDITAIENYLRDRIAEDPHSKYHLVNSEQTPWVLKNEQATREAIISGFQNHLCHAGKGDVVLFYYSGHGSQEQAPEEFWQEEPDHLNETIVCYDSRTPGGTDIADKELRYLIAKVARQDPHIVVIMDCCHSGGGTKFPDGVRLLEMDKSKIRKFDDYIFAEEFSSRSIRNQAVSIPEGKHIALAACRSDQLAKEYKGSDGLKYGAFSYFLLQILQRNNGEISYRDLVRNVNALIAGKVKDQSPNVMGILSENLLDEVFLGGSIPPRPQYFNLTYYEQQQSWAIDGGAVHGLPQGDVSQINLAIASSSVGINTGDIFSHILAKGQVVKVFPDHCFVKITDGEEKLLKEQSYYAIVTSLPLETLKIWLTGDQLGVQIATECLQTAGLQGKPSLYISQVDQAEQADYHLVAKDGQYYFIRPSDHSMVVAPLPETPTTNYIQENAKLAIGRLEHIAKWTNTLELTSPATNRLKDKDVKLEIICQKLDEQEEILESLDQLKISYELDGNNLVPPALYLRVTNCSQQTIFFNVLDLTESFAVTLPFFEEKDSIRLQSQEIKIGQLVDLQVPDQLWSQGKTEFKDYLKLIVSTSEFNASLLEQSALDLPKNRDLLAQEDITKSLQSPLNSLLLQVTNKDAQVSQRANNSGWLTKEIMLTTIRPQNSYLIDQQKKVSLGYGMVVENHPSLKAEASLTTIPIASRDGQQIALPAILQNTSGAIESFNLANTRDVTAGELSILQLNNINNYRLVTAENPLKLQVETSLAEGEHLLPIAYDGQFFLPLGRGVSNNQGTEIILERLPEPTVSGRSLQGAISIMFQKVISEKLGRKFDSYPVLAIATVDDQAKVTYNSQPEEVQARIKQAKNILLFIHGIIGDTASLASSVQRAEVNINGQIKPLQSIYDLVLTFDYENLNTTIEENGRLLGEKLKAVGLGENHGKQLHIIAHSMGGLVSRWFIEKEGGDRIAQHLIMLGTPNAGSPLAKIQDWAFTVLCFGLNSLATVVWPASVLAGLLTLIEKEENALDQLNPNSQFFPALNNTPGPRVPYTIIAGDRSLIPLAINTTGEQPSLAEQLISKISQGAVNWGVDQIFFRQPNDIAVTLDSIKNLNQSYSPEPVILPDPTCDHLTYFNTPAGLQALVTALIQYDQNHGHHLPSRPQSVSASLSTISSEGDKLNSHSTDARDASKSVAGQSSVQSSQSLPSNRKMIIILIVLAILGLIAGGVYLNQQKQSEKPQSSLINPVFIHTTSIRKN